MPSQPTPPASPGASQPSSNACSWCRCCSSSISFQSLRDGLQLTIDRTSVSQSYRGCGVLRMRLLCRDCMARFYRLLRMRRRLELARGKICSRMIISRVRGVFLSLVVFRPFNNWVVSTPLFTTLERKYTRSPGLWCAVTDIQQIV